MLTVILPLRSAKCHAAICCDGNTQGGAELQPTLSPLRHAYKLRTGTGKWTTRTKFFKGRSPILRFPPPRCARGCHDLRRHWRSQNDPTARLIAWVGLLPRTNMVRYVWLQAGIVSVWHVTNLRCCHKLGQRVYFDWALWCALRQGTFRCSIKLSGTLVCWGTIISLPRQLGWIFRGSACHMLRARACIERLPGTSMGELCLPLRRPQLRWPS